MADLLPDPMWRSTHRSGSKGSRWSSRPYDHALRGDHTLCGMSTGGQDWSDPEGVRCADCAAVPEGHAVHWDLTGAGLTYRQVDHWTRRGYLKAINRGVGSGQRRYWPGGEVGVATLMARYVAAGVTLQAAHRAARNGGWLAPGVRVVLSSDQDDYSERSQ